ncbi:MAG TPA: hypothetical protein ENI39_00070 [Anaerolineae bacterium]|nr:hypothetical protein [Anaerolineae bacterium]
MGKADWILGQALFWLLVVAVVIAGVVGIRRAGAVLAAHQAALVGGRAARGPEQGLSQAGSDLSAWWGAQPQEMHRAVEVVVEPARRSVRVVIRGVTRALFGRSAPLGAGSYQRWEDFYPGPPDEFE